MTDPIVDEVRRARQKLWEDCEGDLDKLMDHLKAAEDQDRDRLIRLKPRQTINPKTKPAR